MVAGILITIFIIVIFFSEIGALFGIPQAGKEEREKEDEKYSFGQFKKK